MALALAQAMVEFEVFQLRFWHRLNEVEGFSFVGQEGGNEVGAQSLLGFEEPLGGLLRGE